MAAARVRAYELRRDPALDGAFRVVSLELEPLEA
jgi:hypothetical protein